MASNHFPVSLSVNPLLSAVGLRLRLMHHVGQLGFSPTSTTSTGKWIHRIGTLCKHRKMPGLKAKYILKNKASTLWTLQTRKIIRPINTSSFYLNLVFLVFISCHQKQQASSYWYLECIQKLSRDNQTNSKKMEDNDQIFHDLEQRYLSLKREHDAVCVERDSVKGSDLI